MIPLLRTILLDAMAVVNEPDGSALLARVSVLTCVFKGSKVHLAVFPGAGGSTIEAV
jgi:hypothetical protein